MYYSNIGDLELREFHLKNKVNCNGFECDDGFMVSGDNVRVVPLPYCDTISCTDDLLKEIENKVVLNYKDQSIISNALEEINLNSMYENFEYNLLHQIYSGYNKNYVLLHFYDNNSLFALNKFQFTLTINNETYTGITNNRGNTIIQINTITGEYIITGSNGQTITWEET